MLILNLTQHPASVEQKAAGVIDFDHADVDKTLKAALTFDSLPTQDEVEVRAKAIARLAWQFHEGLSAGRERFGLRRPEMAAMIGGAPYLMGPLEAALADKGIIPLYSFTQRVSAEEIQPDGSVRKTAVFRHEGFIPGRM